MYTHTSFRGQTYRSFFSLLASQGTLPFCFHWSLLAFLTESLLSLSQGSLENIHSFPVLKDAGQVGNPIQATSMQSVCGTITCPELSAFELLKFLETQETHVNSPQMKAALPRFVDPQWTEPPAKIFLLNLQLSEYFNSEIF